MEQNVLAGATFCTNSGLLTATGAETVFDTTVDIQYCIDGKAYVYALNADEVTPTTDYVTGVAFPVLVGGNSVAGEYGEGACVVWGLDSDAAVKCVMGEHQALDSAGNFVVAPQFPTVPKDLCPFAYQIVKAGATAATNVAFGTANWNATGFTNAIQNILVMPSRPQTS